MSKPKPDASKWYASLYDRERTEEAKKAAEIAGNKVREILQNKSDAPSARR